MPTSLQVDKDWHSGKDLAPQIKIGGGPQGPYLRGMSEATKATKAAPKPETPSPAGPGAARPKEIGGPPGPEPTRYGEWERNGRCVDF
jgi:hypothetical protein